jgi:hypothetical protein
VVLRHTPAAHWDHLRFASGWWGFTAIAACNFIAKETIKQACFLAEGMATDAAHQKVCLEATPAMPSLLLERILIAAISALASATATWSFINWRLRRQKKVHCCCGPLHHHVETHISSMPSSSDLTCLQPFTDGD